MGIWKLFRRILLLWLVFLFACAIFPPLFRETEWEGSETIPDADKSSQSSERVRVIDDNTDALMWRLRLIGSARERIILSTFEFWDDQGGVDIMSALYDAADRGVQVQILMDGLMGTYHLSNSGHFQELAQHPNVTVKLYNPFRLLTPWRVNYRLHDKYLIADDFAYLLGGRNTGNLFLGDYSGKQNIDRDILVYEPNPGQGTSYLQLMDYFETVWALPCCKEFRCRAKPTAELAAHYQLLMEAYPSAFQPVDWESETAQTNGVTLLSGDPQPHNKAPAIWKEMVGLMRSGKDVVISTPYIICDKAMYEDLGSVTAQGTRVQLFLNAVESGANPFGCTDYLNQKDRVLDHGIDVFQYWGKNSLHTKTVLIDDSISIVGSCNVDIRSVYLDTELMLVIDSEEINRQLQQETESMKPQSLHCSPDGTEQRGALYPDSPLSFGKKVTYGLLRILIVPLRHLL